jgi:hypothetical protein
MKKNPKMFYIAVVLLSVLAFIMVSQYKFKKSNEKDLSFIKTMPIDSISSFSNYTNVFTPNHLMTIEVNDFKRYVRPKDTLITVRDTVGTVLIERVSMKNFKKEIRLRINQILTLSKKS